MRLTKDHREEVIAKLLSDYKQEISQLTDDELFAHYRSAQVASQLSAEQWQQLLSRTAK